MKNTSKLLSALFFAILIPGIAAAAESAPKITCQFIWQKDPTNVNDRPVVLFSKTVTMENTSVTSDKSRVYSGEISFKLENGVSLLANYYGYTGRRNFSAANLYIKSGATFLNSMSSFNNFESIKKTQATVSTSYVTHQGPIYTGQCWFNNRKPS